ncbi:hypothetical protein PC9H_007604 [Pleurotus ostreatus]|uniref:SH3 domain-containing protein n=1 Tax=Pleurotus ostreatus TaxID=5322 RepID=A0A8H6ZU82_PLEOS|nr:uncharacterized protein PC9H_007604 [Pleurotus ostreatus]KAF7428381.1 hypothetical protein PC9H_007604 [Pleurotus ostreatus]
MIRLKCVQTVLFFSSLAAASLPRVDFDRMGKVGLAGTFAGLDLFDNSTSTITFDPSTSTIFSRTTNGDLTRLGSTNTGGRINAGCQLGDSFYVAGTFSSIGGTSAANVASYTSKSGFTAIGSSGPNGEVLSVFCDPDNSKVWVGGTFSSPGSLVAVWDTSASSWSAPPFSGLSGAGSRVESITTNTTRQSLFFAGSFLTSFEGNSTLNFTNNPNVPFSAGATPFTSSLVPVPLQASQVQGSPSASNPQFSDISAILCPTGPDGPGTSWFGEDGTTAQITVRTFASIAASGIRLGNTFLDGRGTTGFSVTTIPDNTVRTLTYTDPVSRENRTCTDPCPLSTANTIPYQDFLFDGAVGITGVLVKLSQFTGASPGLHLFQLLSSGAFASAQADGNGKSCFAPNPSNTTLTGDWAVKVANTDIPGTIQSVLVATIDVGSPIVNRPTFSWMPYVSAAGIYDINMLVPGCNDFQDCGQRTSVTVTVFPGNGLDPVVTTVSQQNTLDASVSIYSGPVIPSTDQSIAVITMAFPENPQGQGEGGKFEMVADRVQLSLKSIPGDSSNSGPVTSTQGGRSAFGFFEWPIVSSATADARTTLPNSTVTPLDAVGLSLRDQLGSSANSSLPVVRSVAQHSSGLLFVGGDFNLSSGARNIAVFRDNSLSPLPSNGLDGAVSSLVIEGDKLFVGGSFSDTATPSSQRSMRNVAVYDVTSNTWSALQAGLDGPVKSMNNVDGQIQVAGSFAKVLASPTSSEGADAGGLAVWNVSSSSWVNSGGYLRGDMSFVGNGSSNTQFLAGGVSASRRFGATGLVMLKNGNGEFPTVTPLGIQLQSPFSASGTSNNVTRRHTTHMHLPKTSLWFSHMTISHLFSRQAPASQLAPLPASPSAVAPAVLTGTFWTNISSSREVIIFGGNFSYTTSGSSQAQSVAIYDPQTESTSPLQGTQINGVVRTLLVAKGKLYVGGQFTIPGSSANGFAVYDLQRQQWDSVEALQGSSGNPIVRSIQSAPANSNVVFVSGSFSAAGSVSCIAICSLDISTGQWSSLGPGIKGEVASLVLAGVSDDTLIAAGSIALSDNSPSNVVRYSIGNSTWSALGSGSDLPGPVTAIEVNGGNINSIFAAGRSQDNSSFLSVWNGSSWKLLESNLRADTAVTQLAMVPLQDFHSGNDIIEGDRMLMVSGDLDTSVGNISAALYDGQTLFPYIISSTGAGSPGSISSLFHSFSSFSFSKRTFLATGVVILISIAIAAGVVFLLALIGILWTLFSRRDDKVHKVDGAEVEDDDDSTQHRPSSLLEHINAATRTTILGASPFAPYGSEKERGNEGHASADQDPFGPDASNYVRAETPSDAVGGMLEEEKSRPARARYSFDGAEEGELPITAGAELEVLDDKDAAWWYARDVRTGREGVVPAAYLY